MGLLLSSEKSALLIPANWVPNDVRFKVWHQPIDCFEKLKSTVLLFLPDLDLGRSFSLSLIPDFTISYL